MDQPLSAPPPSPPRRTSQRSRARNWIFDLLYATLLFGVVLALPRFLSWRLNTPYPMAAITSGSMWPVLKVNDLIFIQGVDPATIREGDIIVYTNKQSSSFTIHRVVTVSGSTFVMKGDANFKEDPSISANQIVGRMLTWNGVPVRIPYLGAVTIIFGTLRPAPPS